MELFVSRKLGLREILFIIILFTASHLEKLRWHNPYLFSVRILVHPRTDRTPTPISRRITMKGRSVGEISLRTNSRLALPRVVPRVTRCGDSGAISSDLSGGTGGGTTSRQAFSSYIRSDTPYSPFSPLPSASFRSLPAAVGGGNVIAPRHEDQSTLMTLTVGRKRVGFTRLPSNRIVTLLWRIKANSVRVLVMMMMMVWYRVTIIPASHLPPRY